MREYLEAKKVSLGTLVRPKFIFGIFVVMFILYTILFFLVRGPRLDQVIAPESQNDRVYLINNKGCRIPFINPFHPCVSKFYKKLKSPLKACHKESYFIVEGDKLFLNKRKVQEDFGNSSLYCQYKSIIRDPKLSKDYADFEIGLSSPKLLVFGESVKDEFLQIECFKNPMKLSLLFVDYVALVFLKPETEERCQKASDDRLSAEALNIIMIAVDSVSKLNFLRQFPVTHRFLKNTLKPFEFDGYTKVADNTFVNMVPMFTGHFVSYYREDKDIRSTYYDDLDLIWKEFASLGYRTFFIEDTPNFGTFSYLKRGFQHQPTDYYLRPFAVKVEPTNTKWRTKYGTYCFGHTSETEFFYGYLKQFIQTMGDRPFFAFTFISRPSHDDLNSAGLVDEPTYDTLRHFYESGVLNKSVLFFFSDHGIRFGDIRKTFVGKIEERMPFMFQRYPEWFLKKYPDLEKNLATNQKRLTTHFDVHKTLQDLVTFSSKHSTREFQMKNPGFGISLLQEIPPDRTCNDSHILPHWCTCHEQYKLSTRDPYVLQGARATVRKINQWLTNSSCAELELISIIDAYVSVPAMIAGSISPPIGHPYFSQDLQGIEVLDYLITLQTWPNNAIFESTIRNENGQMNIEDISRINKYGNQPWCTEVQHLKKFCFCEKPTLS